MGTDITAVKRSQSRVFIIQFQAGPANVPDYVGHMVAGALDMPFGDVTRHSIPSDIAYGQFETIAQTRGARDNASLALSARYPFQLSQMRELAQALCPLDVQVHMGQCDDPKDFDGGWTLIEVLEQALITNIGVDQLGALTEDDENLITEDPAIVAPAVYQLKRLTFAQRAGVQVQNEVIAIVVCDAVSCGECADPSLGDETVLAVQLSSGGSPGLLAEVVFSQDAGLTWLDTLITTLAANEEPNDAACVGTRFVVVSEDSDSLHWAAIADILDASETWAEVNTGFVVGNGPLAIWAVSPREVYIAAENGYIYRSTDIISGVTVADAGVATTSDLNDIHAASSQVIVAVGAANAVVFSTDGGGIWSSVTGPAVGVVLNAVWARTEEEWWVGDAGGDLWYTLDQGQNWTQKAFAGDGAGEVRDIVFATPSVGYFAHDTATPAGRIFRTINGGQTWSLLPSVGTIPANDRINALAVPLGAVLNRRANQVYGGGLDDAATDGIIVKAA